MLGHEADGCCRLPIERQSAEERGVDNGEADRVDADAKRQDDDTERGEPPLLGQQTKRKAQILEHDDPRWRCTTHNRGNG